MVVEPLSVAAQIAQELKVRPEQVQSTIQLLDEGATVPFIARYRKEATQGLDDTQLRYLFDRLYYLRELEARKIAIINAIREQDKLTPALEEAITNAQTKTRLEDLYLPHRPKRRTKSILAKEAGLLPLAEALLQQADARLEILAQPYINAEKSLTTIEEVIEGAKYIVMDQFAEDADFLSVVRDYIWKHATLCSTVAEKNKARGKKYSDYFTYEEPIHTIPSHRALALFRGRRESILLLQLTLKNAPDYGSSVIQDYFHLQPQSNEVGTWLKETIQLAWKTKIFPKIELELFTRLRELADEEAIKVFARNIHDLLLAAPAGAQVTMGLDPGIRTGVKVVVVDETGKLLDYSTVYPFAPNNEWHDALTTLAKMAAKFHVSLISIGNGTASRDTERLVTDLCKMYPDLPLKKFVVSEAGASVYSASELAAKEFPDLDVSIRGAVSIARRIQDPLAELVKIEPKSIGVGQYQHDVNQTRLVHCLEGVVEDCVNAVGVDVNTASVALLKRVSGLNESLANHIVQYRDTHGRFANREQLKLVPRMGDKSYEQSAGFLRIIEGDNALDASSVHPEAYPLVEKIVKEIKLPLPELLGNKTMLQTIEAKKLVDNQFGLPTVLDVLKELEKPGRDPRGEFRIAQFKEGIETIDHIEIGMVLEGVVSNVTNFGAFVDVGVHQDGLVHISNMTNRFISDPHTIVKAGTIVTVKVIEVDKARQRIGLSMKLHEDKDRPAKPKPGTKSEASAAPMKAAKPKIKKAKPVQKVILNTTMADALAKLRKEIK